MWRKASTIWPEVIDPGHILFGSDWPHPEGLARSLDFREGLADFGADSTESIMGDITASLIGAW